MKKLIAVLLTGFLLATGLVAFSNPTASAACPYTGCQDTTTVGVAITKKKGTRVNIRSRTKVNGSNARPVGNVGLVVRRKGASQQSYRTVEQVNERGRALFRVPSLRRGKYRFVVIYAGNEDKGFRDSRSRGAFKVGKKS